MSAAAVVIEHERTKEKHEVKRQADGSVSLELTEGSTEGFTIWLSNAVGTSEPCELQVLLDTVAPTGGFTTPAPLTVRKGQPFDVKGVWMDIGRLDKKECTFGGVQISPRFGGVSKNEETWTVRHPGLQQTTELQLVLTDLCGNKTTLPFLVKVQ